MRIKKISYFLSVMVVALLVSSCDKAPFTDTQGQPVALSSKNNQWLVLNFWAEWCDPCRDEIPELNALADSGEIRVVGMDFDDSQGDDLKRKIKELGITFPVINESPLTALNSKPPQVLPATYLINPKGELVKTLFGPQTKESLGNQVKKLKEKQADG